MSEVLTPSVIAVLKVMHPNFKKRFYTRELAKLAGVSTWVVSREFIRLVKEEIVKQEQEGREKYYSLNLSSPKTRALSQLFESERRERFYSNNRKLSWALDEFSKRVFDFLPQVQSVILFGSASRGQLSKTSDIDLLVLVPTAQQEAFNELMKSVDELASDVRARYGYPLSAVTMTIKDFETAFHGKKRIAEDILRDGIVLFGEERYYQLLARLV